MQRAAQGGRIGKRAAQGGPLQRAPWRGSVELELLLLDNLLVDVELGRGWVVTPSFGAGYYNASSGLDLGFDAEFRTAVELARRFGRGQRLGLCFAHLSNGSLSDTNPGTETLGISYSFPIDFLFRRAPAAGVPDRTE